MTDTSAQAAAPSPSTVRKVALAAMAGSAIEWYDFFIYLTAAALVFGPLFFPGGSEVAGGARRVQHGGGRLRGASYRRLTLRPLRGPARPQTDPGDRAADHGHGDDARRPLANLQDHRGSRPDSPLRAALLAGPRRRRTVGRSGAPGDGVRPRGQAGLLWQLRPDGGPRRALAR